MDRINSNKIRRIKEKIRKRLRQYRNPRKQEDEWVPTHSDDLSWDYIPPDWTTTQKNNPVKDLSEQKQKEGCCPKKSQKQDLTAENKHKTEVCPENAKRTKTDEKSL